MSPDGKQYNIDTVLSDEAIEWLIKLNSGRATEGDRLAFMIWRQQSDEHELAAQEAELVWQGLGLAGSRMRRAERKSRMTRRAVLGGAVLLVGGITLERSGLIGPYLLAEHRTGIGEQRTIMLADGSSVLLNADTALSVKFDTEVRLLQLFRGQAAFMVKRDVSRPFVVEAVNGLIRATDTAFDVDIRPQGVAVTVLLGVVDIATDTAPLNTVKAEADQRVHYGISGQLSVPESVDSYTETAWRRGKLIFNRRALGDVVAELERYRRGKIIITSDRLRSLEVTGAFDLREPDAVLNSIEETLPVRVTRLPLVTIIT